MTVAIILSAFVIFSVATTLNPDKKSQPDFDRSSARDRFGSPASPKGWERWLALCSQQHVCVFLRVQGTVEEIRCLVSIVLCQPPGFSTVECLSSCQGSWENRPLAATSLASESECHSPSPGGPDLGLGREAGLYYLSGHHPSVWRHCRVVGKGHAGTSRARFQHFLFLSIHCLAFSWLLFVSLGTPCILQGLCVLRDPVHVYRFDTE